MYLIHDACIPVCLLATYLMSAFVIFTVMLVMCIYCTLYKFGHLERAGWVIGYRWNEYRAVATMTQSHYKFPNVNLNNYVQTRTLHVVAISDIFLTGHYLYRASNSHFIGQVIIA